MEIKATIMGMFLPNQPSGPSTVRLKDEKDQEFTMQVDPWLFLMTCKPIITGETKIKIIIERE